MTDTTVDFHAPIKGADDVAARIAQVATSLKPMKADHEPGVICEFLTSEPYTNQRLRVDAVGFVGGDVLLTLKPVEHESEASRVLRVAAIIREVDGNHELGAAALAEALVKRGVLPTRDW